MEKKEDYEKLYDMLLGYEQEIHKKNQKRIRIGLRCLIIIPLIFLALLFWTESSKIVFLILEQQERDALIGDGIAQVEERIRTVLQTAEQELLTDSTKE